jgi:Flagellar basal body-associated protein
VEKRLPIIKDAIIDVISSKTSDFVRTPEGREALRLELIRRLNIILVEGGVRNIYFTEFVVQTS